MEILSANDRKCLPLFVRFIKSQLHKIDIDKWCEGFKICEDPGQDYIIHWINDHAIEFRKAWEKSSCKKCKNWDDCGWKVVCNCQNFISLED